MTPLAVEGRQVRQGLLGGVWRNTAATPEKPQDSEEICCDTCSATRVAIGKKHPSRDVIFSDQILAQKCKRLSHHMTSLSL